MSMWPTYAQHKAIGRALMCERGQHNWKPAYRELYQSRPNPAAPWFLGLFKGLFPVGYDKCPICGALRLHDTGGVELVVGPGSTR